MSSVSRAAPAAANPLLSSPSSAPPLLPAHLPSAPLQAPRPSQASRPSDIVTVERDLRHTVSPPLTMLRPCPAGTQGLATAKVEAARMQHLHGLFERSWAPVWQFRPWSWASATALAAWCLAPLHDLGAYLRACMLDGLGHALAAAVRTFKFGRIQAHGANALVDAQGQFRSTGPVLWMFSHADDPGDAMLLAGLRNALPKIPDRHGGHRAPPHVVMKESETWYERLVTSWLFGDSFTHLLKNRRRFSDAERKAHNDRVLRDEPPKVLARGAHVIQFPEGHTSSNGTIVAKPVGALKAFAHGVDGPALCVPVTVTYESLGKQRLAALLNVGSPMAIDDGRPDDDAQLAQDVSSALGRLNTLTLSGLLGAALLEARRAGKQVQVTEASLGALVAAIVDPVLGEKASGRDSTLHWVAVDEDLRDPATRLACVRLALKQLRAQRLIDSAGNFCFDKLTGDAQRTRQFEATHFDKDVIDQRYNLQREFPLAFWGMRTLQQLRELPALQALWATRPVT